MTWRAEPTGKRGRQPSGSDAAILTGLTMMALLGVAWRQTTGLVESLPHLVGLDWTGPDVGTLSRHQTTLKRLCCTVQPEAEAPPDPQALMQCAFSQACRALGEATEEGGPDVELDGQAVEGEPWHHTGSSAGGRTAMRRSARGASGTASRA